MKRIFAILVLVSVVATGVSQNITKPGLYDKHGQAVVTEEGPVMVNVTLRVVKESFTPGIYARYAQKCLGAQVAGLATTSVELADARLALGAVEKPVVALESNPYTLPLPLNIMSREYQAEEEQADAAANMIFSLRRSRLDLITGEVGENVFGAGLKAALDEIAHMERTLLEMFYGTTSTTEEIHTFNIAITPEKSEYMVCRFNDEKGIVAVDDLSGKPIVVKVEVTPHKEYAELQMVNTKSKLAKEYHIIPQSKCMLIVETKLCDTLEFVSPLYEKVVTIQPTK